MALIPHATSRTIRDLSNVEYIISAQPNRERCYKNLPAGVKCRCIRTCLSCDSTLRTFDLSNCVQLCFVSMLVQNDYRDVILSHMFANERNMKNKFPYIVPCVFLFLNFKMYVLVILITMVVSLSMDWYNIDILACRYYWNRNSGVAILLTAGQLHTIKKSRAVVKSTLSLLCCAVANK